MNLGRYFIRKSIATIQAESAKSALKRSLGKWNLISLGIGCIIGTGIFVMTGTAAANHAGPAIMLSFIFTGIACAFVGLCYAELASAIPVSGSAYTYTYATLGEGLAWMMGWLLLLEYGIAAATVAVGWSGYIVSFLKEFGIYIPIEWATASGLEMIQLPGGEWKQLTAKLPEQLAASGIDIATLTKTVGIFNIPAFLGISMVTLLLIVGVSESAKVNNIIVFIKLSVILLFVVIGIFYINPENWKPFVPENSGPDHYGWDGVFKAASIIFFAYVGFEAVSTAAQEAKNPQKDMSFGILGSLFICTLLYIAVSGVMTGVVHYSLLGVPDPMAVAVDKLNISWLTIDIGGQPFKIFPFLIKVGAIAGLSSVMLVLLYGQTRILYNISRDGLLPDFFCKIHSKFRTPYINTIMVGCLVAIVAGMTPITLLGDLVNLGTLSAFMIVCFTVLYLRRKHPDLPRSFRTPGMPFVPLLGIVTCGYLVYKIFYGYDAAGSVVLTESGREVLHYTGPYLLIGIAIYMLYGQFNSRTANKKAPLAGDEAFLKSPHEPQVD